MTKPPLALTDAELDIVFAAARPLDVDLRDPFLQAVANALMHERGPIGPGVVHRVCRELQRQFFVPPQNEKAPSRSPSRWDRDEPHFAKVSKQAVG